MMKSSMVYACLALVGGSLLCGCGNDFKKKIVGKWSNSSVVGQKEAGYEFKADGTYQSWLRGSKINSFEEGTYKIEGSKLIVMNVQTTTNGKVLPPVKAEEVFGTILRISDTELVVMSEGVAYHFPRIVDSE